MTAELVEGVPCGAETCPTCDYNAWIESLSLAPSLTCPRPIVALDHTLVDDDQGVNGV